MLASGVRLKLGAVAADGSDNNVMCLKFPPMSELSEDAPGGEIVDRLKPRPGEIIVRKRLPSSFSGTDLAAAFTMRGGRHELRLPPHRDQRSRGRPGLGPHEANLFDMGQKYADVISRDEAIAEPTSRAQAQAAE